MIQEGIKNNTSDIRLAPLLPKSLLGRFLKVISPLLEQIVGIAKLRKLYLNQQLSGLEKQQFSTQLLSSLGVTILGEQGLCHHLPKSGRCIVVCNHPYGMIEGIIVAKVLTDFRADTKIMANVGLKVFKEIEDYFIFANPLKPKAAINTSAIKQCFQHVENEGLLVIFPAGRVSFYQADKQRITDGQWNRLAVNIAQKTATPILPVFISGTNSALFHRLGRIYYRFRLLMLAREMFKLQHHHIKLTASHLISPRSLTSFKSNTVMNDFLRMQCYLNDEHYFSNWPADEILAALKPIIAKNDEQLMLSELLSLPDHQKLLTFKTFSVYYGYQTQIPNCVREITRLREITFRTLNEGSGEPCDTDKFDATYMHLFIYDHAANEIIGAYRIGQTDLLQKYNDKSQLYLSQMFNFSSQFINQQQPCLEMGRSFIIAKYQNSFHGLLLLWKGIGAFVCQNPQYRTLYGTVSLSKLYDPRSVALINEVLVTAKNGVEAKTQFASLLHPEVHHYLKTHNLSLNELSEMVMGIERDGKDLPVLLKQYHKLGAKFHCIGIDSNFNHTPGLLLSVDLPKAPDKLLKLYLGKGKEQYQNHRDELKGLKG